MNSPSFVLLGRPSAFTAAALEGLLAGGARPLRVFLRARVPTGALAARVIAHIPVCASAHHTTPRTGIPVRDPRAGPQSVTALAARHAIALEHVSDVNADAVLARVCAIAPDVLLAACLDQRVGPRLRALARQAALNIHPSVLPAHRGPEPVFWQLREGERRPGVSVHTMVDAFDSGPILAQARLAVPEGTGLAAVERDLARLGGRVAAALMANAELPVGAAQDETAASVEGAPGPGDLALDVRWSARRAFVFMRATGAEHPLDIAGERLVLTGALDHDAGRTLPVPFLVRGSSLEVRFSPGVLRARGRRVARPGRSPPLGSG